MADQHQSNTGVQIKVWLPDGFYDYLRSRATRHKTSVAAEARRLMERGVAGVEALDGLTDRLDRLDAFAHQHLEPLLYTAAADAAYGAAAWRHQHTIIPALAEGRADLERDLAYQATVRIKRGLRLSPATTEDTEEVPSDVVPSDSPLSD